jgi:hypothetical protein
MIKALVISLSLLSVGFRLPDGFLVHRLIVLPESKLIINGKTNVNSFRCAIPKYIGKDTLVLQEGGKNVRPVFVKGAVSLDATSFDCGMAMMTSDFRKTINSKSYPNIVIDFISFEKNPSYKKPKEVFRGIVKISISGVTKVFEMDCSIEPKPSGLIHLTGGRDFLFSDFNLETPTRMMGLVKVDQTLNVAFHLVLRLDDDY